MKGQMWELLQAGQLGSTFEKGTTERTGNWWKIEAIDDTVIASMTDATKDGDALAAITLDAGCSIKGKITKFKLTSGVVVAYKDPDTY